MAMAASIRAVSVARFARASLSAMPRSASIRAVAVACLASASLLAMPRSASRRAVSSERRAVCSAARLLGACLGGLVGDVAFLAELGVALLALDRQTQERGLAVLGRDRDLGLAQDVVAFTAPRLGDPRQRGQALGVEGVVLR